MNFRFFRLVCPMLPVSLDCPFLIAQISKIEVQTKFHSLTWLAISIILEDLLGTGDGSQDSNHRVAHTFPGGR
jgi:hypothetical protein